MIEEAAMMLQAVAVQGAAAETGAGPFAAASAVPDDVLAQQRGGIRLPGGIDVSLSIDTVTALDGSDHHGLVPLVPTSLPSGLAADKRLVNLYDTFERHWVGVFYRGTDAMRQIPSRLIGHVKRALQLQGRVSRAVG